MKFADFDAAYARASYDMRENMLEAYMREKLIKQEPSEIVPPSPDQVAMAILQGMLANPKAPEDPAASCISAWTAVPHFYRGRQFYVDTIAPLFFVPAYSAEAEVAAKAAAEILADYKPPVENEFA